MPARAKATSRGTSELVEGVRVVRRHCELTVIQVSEEIGQGAPGLGPEGVAAYLMLGAFAAATKEKLTGKQAWLGFIASPQAHWQNLTLWMCFSSNVKPVVIHMICERAKSLGGRVEIEGMHSSACNPIPVVYAGPDGCELLLPKEDMSDPLKFAAVLEAAEGNALSRETRVEW